MEAAFEGEKVEGYIDSRSDCRAPGEFLVTTAVVDKGHAFDFWIGRL